jgi:hypothetical protein
VDPLTAHECGNQRYLAIPWLDACLDARLPAEPGAPLQAMPASSAMLAPLPEPGVAPVAPVPAASYAGVKEQAIWLPGAAIARAWLQYVTDTAVADVTPPPAPTHLHVGSGGGPRERPASLHHRARRPGDRHRSRGAEECLWPPALSGAALQRHAAAAAGDDAFHRRPGGGGEGASLSRDRREHGRSAVAVGGVAG